MKKLLKLLKDSEYAVVFTGAGISTLSGLKDFRGKNGLYKEKDAEKIFDLDYFLKDPSYYYENTIDLIYGTASIKPNIVHNVLAKLEEKNIIKSVITQNIDLLHQRAGSKQVIEVHGTPMIHRCMDCGAVYDFDFICKIVLNKYVPYCTDCAGIIKPDITFFGEQLPEKAIHKAISESCKADFMLILGSSLTVYPAASLPVYLLENGGKIAIVNDMETPLSRYSEVNYRDLHQVFESLDKEF